MRRLHSGMMSARRGVARHGQAPVRHSVFREAVAAGLHELADIDYIPRALDGRPLPSRREKLDELVAFRERFSANANVIGMSVNAEHPEGRPRKRLKAALVELHERLGVDVWWQDDAERCCRSDGATSCLDFTTDFNRRHEVAVEGELYLAWRPVGVPRFGIGPGRDYQPSSDELRTAIDAFHRHGIPAIVARTTDADGLPATAVELHKVGPATDDQLALMEQGYNIYIARLPGFDPVEIARFTDVLGRNPSLFLLANPAPLHPEELAAWRTRTGERRIWEFDRLGSIPAELIGLAGPRLFGACRLVSGGPNALRFATAAGKEWTLARSSDGSTLGLTPVVLRTEDLVLMGDYSREQASALLASLGFADLAAHVITP